MAATAIGNVADIPARSLEALKQSDLLIFEEDRPARQFLKAAGLHREYWKLSEHQEQETLKEASRALKAGETVVYMSDQGTANFADPGLKLLELAYQLEATVNPIPGPSSLTAAISACPFDLKTFHYLGFLPRQESERNQVLHELSKTKEALVILDTPYRKNALLESAASIFPKRRAFLAIDLSGPKQEFIICELKSTTQKIKSDEKVNFVLIIEGTKHA